MHHHRENWCLSDLHDASRVTSFKRCEGDRQPMGSCPHDINRLLMMQPDFLEAWRRKIEIFEPGSKKRKREVKIRQS